jgi:hypothetical protein
MHFFLRTSTLLCFLAASTATAEIDRTRYDPNCGIRISEPPNQLKAQWSAGNDQLALTVNLTNNAKLIAAIEVNGAAILKDADVEYSLTVGSRKTPSAAEKFGYVFFDKPADRKSEKFPATLDRRKATVESTGRRAILRISRLSAGPFEGELDITLYAGSPLVHVQAAMTPRGENLAYIYDATIQTAPMRLAYEDVEGNAREVGSGGDQMTPVAVKWRTIVAQSDSGSLACFPAPHAFFFPRDRTDNFKFAQYGKGRFGLRQDPAGGGAFVPWFDAPDGKMQRMDLFLLASSGKAADAIEAAKRYTHGDTFKPLDGRLTFTSHYHSRLSVAELAGKPAAKELAAVFKRLGVDIVHLAEFHGDGHFNDPGQVRLNEMKTMFDLCRKFSDDRLLLIPGEEGSQYMGEPWPPAPKIHPGHWMYLFPKPVYLTWVRKEGVPFSEEIPPYGKVYHVGNRDDMIRLFREERGIGWTTHPRIKASFAAPDAFKDQPWYRDLWLGAAWKAMPGNLAEDRLGKRCLDLLDDMSNRAVSGGYDFKRLPGEVDVFEIDHTHELYGHMNINYLKLANRPSPDNWEEILDVLRRGGFFTTTGEVLLHSVDLKNGKITADAEWTLPLAFAEIITGDGQTVKRQRIDLSATGEMGRDRFEWKMSDPAARWARLEIWDVARDGGFTQVLPIN